MKKTKKILTGNKGFTLLEILVVLTIMGFLIAMVAPRLAGISGGAVDTVCDTNQNRSLQMLSAYYLQTDGEFPNNLTNLVVTDGTTYYTPSESNEDPDDGQETLAAEFAARVAPNVHYLSQAEVLELEGLGITTVYNLNSYDNFTTDGTGHGPDGTASVGTEGNPMEEIDLDAGVGVMMSGLGAANGADFASTDVEDLGGYAEGDFYGRIVFGLGPESGLITSGLVTNAAHCPGGLQNDDNITYNDYNLVVPRLAATAERMPDTGVLTDADAAAAGVQYYAYGYTEDDEADLITSGLTSTDGMKTRAFSFAAQETFLYSTMCPEGHMYPANDSDAWAIDVDADGAVAASAF